MAAFCEAFPNEHAARRAARAISEVGVRPRRIRLLTGTPLHDVRDERVGAFVGSVAPSDRVGTFAGRGPARRQGAGAFAGDPAAHRTGSFGDIDLDVVDGCEGSAAHPWVTGDAGLTRVLRTAGLSDDTVEHVVEEIHHGHAVVIADVPLGSDDAARSDVDHDRPAA
jgi:hypothetical protein